MRSGSAGLDFRKRNLRSRFPAVFFMPCEAADPRT
jgi:hypothetical protein